MESTASEFKSLYEKVKAFAQTSIELYKLQAIDATADVVSSLIVRVVLVLLISVFSLFVNIGLALLIGKYVGDIYLGFFAVSLLYIILAVLFYLFRESVVKTPIANLIVAKLMKAKNANNDIKEILKDEE